ncbi:MAG TPA: hypothetical protein EYQ50_08110 [Verrucomicrobiales bacterium]|nr:hypothetical protein [Verrucomicrobiales bacterium]HIL68461.1 hypothetical protein [Verrucomicrobiota bacterium]
MSRIAGVDPKQTEPPVSDILQDQNDTWGKPLNPYLVYARRPSLLRSVTNMWQALGESGLLPQILCTLICRRVASINGCVF